MRAAAAVLGRTAGVARARPVGWAVRTAAADAVADGIARGRFGGRVVAGLASEDGALGERALPVPGAADCVDGGGLVVDGAAACA